MVSEPNAPSSATAPLIARVHAFYGTVWNYRHDGDVDVEDEELHDASPDPLPFDGPVEEPLPGNEELRLRPKVRYQMTSCFFVWYENLD